MTFTEAAVEVLRLVGKPLHYKKITEIAIDRNLLSHVGKTPEITMSSRLATMVKKDRGDAPILKVKPGVFGLREFDDAVLKKAEKESGHDYELPPEKKADEKRRPGATRAADKSAADDSASDDSASDDSASDDSGAGDDEPHVEASKKKLPGQDVFAEEDDDDEPILANLEARKGKKEKSKDDSDDDEEGGRGRRKRRRRRRRKGGGGDEDDDGGRSRDDRGGRGRSRDDRGSRGRDERGSRSRDDRGSRGRDDRGSRGRDDRRRGGKDAKLSGDWDREPGEGEVLGHDLADAVREILDGGRGPRPLDYRKLAELLVKKNKLSGDAGALVPTVAAAVRADGARRAMQGLRPRFREVGSEIELVEWALPNEAQRAEQDAMKSAARQRDLARRAFLRRVADLPMAGLAELLATWLNAEGVVQLRAIRRPSARGNAFHLAGVLKRGFEESRLAIVVYRDGTDLGREHVMEVRGSLHHYDNASAAWLVTTGQVLSGAKDEASAAGREPCGLFDGAELARAMERVGVGLTRHTIAVVALDLDLLDSLGRGQGKPARDTDREREEKRRERDDQDDDARDESKKSDDDSDGSGDDDSDDDDQDSDDDKGGPRRRRRRGGRGRRGRRDEERGADDSDDDSDESADSDDDDDQDSDDDDRESIVDTDEGPGSADATGPREDDSDDDDSDDDDSDDDDSDDSDDDDDDSDDSDDSDDDDSDDDDSDDDDSDDDDSDSDDSDSDDSDDDSNDSDDEDDRRGGSGRRGGNDDRDEGE